MLAREHEQGQATPPSQIGASLGSALTIASGGALIAARQDTLDGGVFAILMGISLAAAVIALTLTHRMRPQSAHRAA